MNEGDLGEVGAGERQMPVLFVGHGSPTNALDDNEFTRAWRSMAERLPRPRAILCVSAHWYIDETLILSAGHPRTIHDFWGFPEELYQVRYPALGSPADAEATARLVKSAPAGLDHSWGLDHGSWAVLIHLYPRADVPVYQMSVNRALSAEVHYRIGAELRALRREGILIVGSGNLVHNLGKIDWRCRDSGFLWAEEFSEVQRELIAVRDDRKLIRYPELGAGAILSIPTPDHYLPLMYVLGASDPGESVEIFNDSCVFGSVSMTCVAIGVAR